MNRHSALTLVPQQTAVLAWICCLGSAIAADTNFSASIFVKLDRESFLETEEIRGKIHLKVLPGKSVAATGGQAEPDAAPRLQLLFDSQLAAVPLEVAMNRSLDKSIIAGGEVEVPFEIKTWPEFSHRLRTLEGIAKLRAGQHHCYAVMETFAGYEPVIGWAVTRRVKWFTTIGATQHFEIIATGARTVSPEELIQAARGGADSFKMTVASFFGDHGQLAAGDLLSIMEGAGPETKGRLARLYQNRGGALEGLTPFFERPKDKVLLDGHTNAPFFLKLAPGEALRFVYAGPATIIHNVNGLDRNYVTPSKPENITHAPMQPGVYRVGCDIHVSTWAWVLVTDSNKGTNVSDSPVRFIQQPQRVGFESVDRDQFRRYLASRNIEELVSSGKSVQVMGPAVFSGDLPTDTPVSGRVESGRVREGAFELKLSELATNQHYIIESTYDIKSGTWTPVHSFIARETNHEWSDPLGKEVNVMFYRIRAGAY